MTIQAGNSFAFLGLHSDSVCACRWYVLAQSVKSRICKGASVFVMKRTIYSDAKVIAEWGRVGGRPILHSIGSLSLDAALCCVAVCYHRKWMPRVSEPFGTKT